MPAKSDAQRRLMYAIVNDPSLAKKLGVPLKVAKEFVGEDTKTDNHVRDAKRSSSKKSSK